MIYTIISKKDRAMKKRIHKICAALTVAAVMLGAFLWQGNRTSLVSVNASAASAQYSMTSEYRSSRFYKNLTSLSLSGDGARDVVAIAMSQVGYHEGDSESDFGGQSTTGTRDYVEYNVLYGKLDNGQGNGVSYGYYWCASFVNWCLRQAGIPEDATAGAEVSCQRWFSACKSEGIYKSKSGYIPQLGDIIFFKDKGSAVDSTHVGLVRYSDGHNVYTVEGNTSNGNEYSSNGEYVALKKHALSSDYIVGYATPEYGESKTHRRVDYTGSFRTLGDYISETEISLFSDSDLASESGKVIPEFTAFKVTQMSADSYKVSFNGNEGYIPATANVVQITTTENVYVTNYLDEDGSLLFMTQYRKEGQQKSVYMNEPKRDNAGFVCWLTTDGSNVALSPGDPIPETGGDITLRAVWDSNYYVVTFKNTDGTIIDQKHGYYGTRYDIPTPPEAPEGYVFFGWGASVDGVIRGNATYTAQFIDENELASAGAQAELAKKRGCTSSAGGALMTAIASFIGIAISFKKKK